MPEPPLRVLLASQGGLGTTVMGAGTAARSMSQGLAQRPDVDARCVGTGARGRLASAALRPLGPLSNRDLDLFTLRFHVVEALRGRALVRRELRHAPADVVHVTSHVLGLLLGGPQREAAVVLNVDATTWDWAAFGHQRPVERWSRLMTAPDRALERRALTRADLVVAWSGWSADGVRRVAPKARVVTLHPGLDTVHFRPTDIREPGPARLLFVGGRLAAKGGLDLLAATEEHRHAGTVVVDLVTPDPVPAAAGVRQHRFEAGDPGLVHLFQQADALCLPSWGDAVPWVILEALACATPVIGSTVGAIPELVDHGRAGRLVPPRDPRALRAAVDALVADPESHAALGRHGRRLVERDYDLEQQTNRLVEVLRDVARRPRPGRAT